MINRRDLLQRGAAFGATVAAGSLLVPEVFADPDTMSATPQKPAASLTEPAIYPFTVGKTEAYIIHDGIFRNPGVQPAFAPEGTPDEVNRILTSNYLPTDHITLSLNILVLRQGKEITLVDTGGGGALGPTSGRLAMGLLRLGIKPEQVTNVIITHAHGDHIAGLLVANGKSAFPKATVYISKTELDFWTGANPDLSQLRAPDDFKKSAIASAQKILGGVKVQTKTFAPGDKVAGFEIVDAPGHTPGHSVLSLTSGGDSLLVIADSVHSWALQFPHPEWTMVFDTVPSQAITSRRAIFDRAATGNMLVSAYHLPFPGLGYIRAAGSGYEWVAQPWVF